jgi:polyhydroxybutyrate depolymerase
MAVVQRWAQLDGCPSTPPTTQVQSPVTTTTWSGGGGGSAVKLIAVDGGGHTWFASGFGAVSGAVDATTEIWKFLSAHRLGG